MRNKRIYIFAMIFLVIIIYLFFYFKVNAVTKLEGIENFPSSYQPYLNELKKKHPNWNFVALYTNLDWNSVINEENVFGKNLVPKNYSDNWKNTNYGEYNVEVDSGWVDSSRRAVEYCMDPRNFLNEVRIFQFEELSYNSNTNTIDGIEKILYGTEFYKKQVSDTDSRKYSDLILNAAQSSSVSSYHLASRIKQEVGPFLTHNSISGTVEGYEGLYNFYNIGATSSSEPLGAIKNGLQYAKDGKGANSEIRELYLIPWNTKERAITGGAIFIGSSYINVGQNTVYLEKFDVTDEGENGLFWHQYMTNVLAPYSESKSIYNGYQKSGLLNTAMSFIIPIYENMPTIQADSPAIEQNDFSEDNRKVICNATNVNIRTGPSTSYEIITTVSNPDEMIRLKKGIQSGERWDKVMLENGIVGYIYQTYVTEVAYEVDVTFEIPLQEENSQVTGIDYNNNSISNIREKIISNLEVEIVGNDDLVGTGSKIQIKENGIILKEYTTVLYGDANGDGKINSTDLLVLQRHILKLQQLEEIYQIACNISKNGKEPSSIDLLLIQRHILKLKIIEQ